MTDTKFADEDVKTDERGQGEEAAPVGQGCGSDTTLPSGYAARYALPGAQVEPAAAWWLETTRPIRLPTLDEVKAALPSPRPFFGSQAELEADFDTLSRTYVRRRRQPLAPQTPVSEFLNLQSPPFGTLFNTQDYTQFGVTLVLQQHRRLGRQGYTVIGTGEELARAFERETPGLYHQHALNWFLYERPDISPPRQARIRMALEMSIYAALCAAWYYKWAYNADEPGGPRVSFALRPYEHARDPDFVLFDREIDKKGDGSGAPKSTPCPSPGTPRHPAYPSGHSTYSAAGSRMLEYFFGRPGSLDKSDAQVEAEGDFAAVQLRRLADNIGQARLFAGVHWVRDHEFGQEVGRAVADLIIAQLRADCVPPRVRDDGAPIPSPSGPPPGDAEILALRARPCQSPDRRHDNVPPREQRDFRFSNF